MRMLMQFKQEMLSDKARSITPYTAGEQVSGDGWIKLNTNENPYPPNIDAEFDLTKLNLYPDPDCLELRKKLARDNGVTHKNIFIGNGSDEVLALAFQAFFAAKTVSMPDVSYSFYPVWAQLFDCKPNYIKTKNWEIDWSEYSANCIIANPNAPTSLAIDIEDIPTDGVVIIDEAYIDFANIDSAANLTKQYDNLLVVRTFSKSYSLAGLRVGYAIGSEQLIDGLERIKNSFNSYPVDTIAQKIALSAKPNVDRVIKTRGEMKEKLDCLDSQGNFVWWNIENAKEMYDYLYQNKILVRYWEKYPNNLRVTIGTDEQMRRFIECIEKRMKLK